MKNLLVVLLLSATTQLIFAQDKKPVQLSQFAPGKPWPDNKGKHINAHSAGVIFYSGIYYWHGESKREGKTEKDTADAGIGCYTSTDLINWQNVGLVMSVDYKSPESDIAHGCILQRPKVIFNEKTKKFVAFFKLYLKGDGYPTCYTGVATSNSPAGPFTYSHKFLACGSVNGSGDFALYKDEDGYLYHIAVRKPDKRLSYARMSDDYLLPAEEYTPYPDVELHTEAPAVVKHNGVYHLFGSASAGWAPTPPRYYTSNSIRGPWKKEANPLEGKNPVNNLGIEKTFGAQSTFILPVQGIKDAYIILFDIWKPSDASNGGYVWLPLSFDNDKLKIKWMDTWNLDFFKK